MDQIVAQTITKITTRNAQYKKFKKNIQKIILKYLTKSIYLFKAQGFNTDVELLAIGSLFNDNTSESGKPLCRIHGGF
ncbi:MAG: hypothetical protein Tsb0021_08860 [Chlamydiales bacterium]